MRIRALQGVLCVVGSLLSAGAIADNCSGTWHNAGQLAETHDLGNGVTLTSFSALSSMNAIFSDRNEMRTGACSGYLLTMPDGKVREVFACARKNNKGEVAVDEGSLEPGAKRGTWKVTSATGSLASSIGDSGWWTEDINDGKVSAGMWGGTCK
jgi:hypothetical protein